MYCKEHEKININLILTKREIEVLRYVVLGLNNEEIGKELYISNNTIKIHIKNIMYKLNELDKLREALNINNNNSSSNLNSNTNTNTNFNNNSNFNSFNNINIIKIKNRIQLAVIAIKYGVVEIYR